MSANHCAGSPKQEQEHKLLHVWLPENKLLWNLDKYPLAVKVNLFGYACHFTLLQVET